MFGRYENEEMDGGSEGEGTEITLGMGKLLMLFFGLVIFCGISLGVGYSLGRDAARKSYAAAVLAAPACPSASAASKPEASQVAAPMSPDCTSGDNCPPQSASTHDPADLTFYQTVQQKDEHPKLTPPEPAPAPAPRPVEARATLGAGYLVQIAAVRNQDDAKLLNDTLQKQRYPAIISQPGDKLFHVQVGPYANAEEAKAIRSRLIAAGYNAFIKH